MKLFGVEFTKAGVVDNLREGLADVERQMENVSWMSFSGLGKIGNIFKDNYNKTVARSRQAYYKNPIVGHAINLTTDYVFGEGITTPKASAPDEEDKSNDEVQEILDQFWNDPDNLMSLTAASAQRALSNKLQYDGEINFRLFVDTNGDVFVRILDPMNATPIHDKDDPMRVNFWMTRKGTTKYYIADVSNGLAFLRDRQSNEWVMFLAKHGIKPNEVLEEEYIFHIQINADINDDRGVPLPFRALDWVNDHTRLHGDMSSFVHAQAQYAWKKKIKGTKSQVQAFKARGQQNTNLTNPSFQPGSTIIENASVDNQPIDLKAGSGALFTTAIKASFRMITVAFGLFEHYFGDLGNANLATAKSVELPMLKKFRSLQTFWESAIKAILWFQLDMKIMVTNVDAFEFKANRNRLMLKENKDFSKGRFIDLDFTPILQQDIKDLADAWSIAKNEGLAPIETSKTQFMLGAGINNIEEELQKEFEEKQEAPSGFGAPASIVAPEPTEEEVKEAANVATGMKKAMKLADKNQAVISLMNTYIKEIGTEYKKMKSAIRGGAKTKETGVKIKGLRSKLNTFKEKMNKLAVKNFPKASQLGFDYVVKHIDIVEVQEAVDVANAFVVEQVAQNLEYLDGLTDSMYDKLSGLSAETFASAEVADAALVEAIGSYESRVGSYGAYLWTVEVRAVKETGSAQPKTEVNFVGVEDKDNCPGCLNGLSGNPWTMENVPVPGEQDCLTNCRHAIQVTGDAELTESDMQVLRDEEARAREGYILEASRKGYKEKLHEAGGCSCCR